MRRIRRRAAAELHTARPRPATIRDVADRAGVSTATVSRVLAGLYGGRPQTRARVVEAARALDYHPSGIARSLKLQTTGTIGLIVTDIANPFYPELVRAIEDSARRHGLAILLCNSAEDPDRELGYLQLLRERRVDGIIVASGGLSERQRRWLARPPLPVVLVNSALEDADVPAILTDNVAATRVAVEHLVELGHRRIAQLAGPDTSTASLDRATGFREGLAGAGIDPGLGMSAAGDGHVAGGFRATTALLEADPGLTAIVCYNDLSAIGALQALRTRGLGVPLDVSVVGFDDIDIAAYLDPPLTTIAQAIPTMADWAVDRLTDALSGGSTGFAQTVRVPGELRARGSTSVPGTR